jgi:hypothetical protein
MQHSEFVRKWREFADAHAKAAAPARLRHAVMAAWDGEHDGPAPAPGMVRPFRTAAAVALTGAVAMLAAVMVREPVPRAWPQPTDTGATARDAAMDLDTQPMVRLVADAAFEGEPLTLVRLRLPRASLASIGITLGDAEPSSLVDVDVVVGSDGLARAIQRIQPAIDAPSD